MASAKKTDSSDLNHWKLCNKVKSFIFIENSNKLSNAIKINLSKNKIHNSKVSSGSSQSLQIRYVNPAIYVESLNVLESKLHKNEFFQKKSDSANLHIEISIIYTDTDSSSSFDTYRYGFLISLKPLKTSTTSKSKSLHIIERRCKIDDQSLTSIDYDRPEIQRFPVNGKEIIQISTSLSNYTLSQHGSSISVSKKQAYKEWIKKKKHDILQKKKEANKLEIKKKIEEERLKQEKEKKAEIDHHNFLIWIEKKRNEQQKENVYKWIITEREFELKHKIEELEEKFIIAKEIYLKQWHRKKERERKAQKINEELKLQKFEGERQKRLEKCLKAFKNWHEKTKNRPKPATQGFLPHQQAKPKYINPIPWIIDQITSEISESQIVNNEATLNPIKSNIKNTVVQK